MADKDYKTGYKTDEKLRDLNTKHNLDKEWFESTEEESQFNRAIVDIMTQVAMSVPPFNFVFGVVDIASAAYYYYREDNPDTKKELMLSIISLIPMGGRLVGTLVRKKDLYANIAYPVTVHVMETLNNTFNLNLNLNIDEFLMKFIDEEAINASIDATIAQIKKDIEEDKKRIAAQKAENAKETGFWSWVGNSVSEFVEDTYNSAEDYVQELVIKALENIKEIISAALQEITPVIVGMIAKGKARQVNMAARKKQQDDKPSNQDNDPKNKGDDDSKKKKDDGRTKSQSPPHDGAVKVGNQWTIEGVLLKPNGLANITGQIASADPEFKKFSTQRECK